jgi:hypothetical protein
LPDKLIKIIFDIVFVNDNESVSCFLIAIDIHFSAVMKKIFEINSTQIIRKGGAADESSYGIQDS